VNAPVTSDPVPPASFLAMAERDLLEQSVETARADWVHATYITDDSQSLAARANARLIASTVRWAKQSLKLPGESLGAEDRRKVKLLRLSMSLVAPDDPKEGEELSRTVAEMQGTYAKGTHVPLGATGAVDLQGLSRILSDSREPARLEDAWVGWHRVGRAIRDPFVRYVALANRGARELGFEDMGAMWRTKYDMAPEAFVAEVERLWRQVRPLYESLHAYTRMRLRGVYGSELVPERGLMPAHLLGNMWAQSWEGVFPLVAPPEMDPGFDLTRILVDRKTTPVEMVHACSTARPGGHLPCERLGHRLRGRPADQDVHRDHG
jgi:peptidyl-dipeptidase A